MQGKDKGKPNPFSPLSFLRLPLGGQKKGGKPQAKGSKPSPKVSPSLIYLAALSLLFWAHAQLVAPLLVQLQVLREEASFLDTNLLAQLEAKQAFLKAEKERLKKELAAELNLSPKGLEEVQSTLYDLARRVGLEAFTLKEAKVQKEGAPLLSAVVVSYELRGSFEQILLFFDLLQARGFKSKEVAMTPYSTERERGLLVVGLMQVFYASDAPAGN